MSTTPTSNPIPSESPKDLAFNAGKIDEFVNSPEEAFSDRFGLARLTLAGIQAEADNVIGALGFVPVDSFEAGATISSRNQALHYLADNNYYRWDGALTSPKVVGAGSTPASSGGVGAGAWVNVTDNTLRSQLATSIGATLVYAADGKSLQQNLNDIRNEKNSLAYVDDFASLVSGDDWTAAIQAAYDTGKVVVYNSSVNYKVTAIINSKGQPYLGTANLTLARTTIPAATVSLNYSKPDGNSFRGIYVQSAYDLCELMRIKSLGFNAVLHYCYFDNNGAIDIDGTLEKLIKNCATAGLNVVINTQNSVAHNNGTVAQVVALSDPFENVIGYSVVDEPGSSGMSLSAQEALISTLRSLTNKKLFSVDFVWRLNTWTKPWSYNYDVFLVDGYSMYYASGTLSDRVNRDLGKLRTDLGACMKMTGSAKVIPCFQAFAEPTSSPVEGISGTYCFDMLQIVQASTAFGKAGNGDFACFVWDASFPSNVSNSADLQAVVKSVVAHADSGEIYRTEPIIFGGVNSVYQRSLSDVIEVAGQKDTENTVDGWQGGGAYPVKLLTGSSETPTKTTTGSINISGIGFRRTFSRYVTKKPALKFITGFGVFENYGPTISGTAALDLYTTPDGGYNQNLVYSGGVTAGTPFRLSSQTTSAWDGVGEDLVISISLSSGGDAIENYRRFIYGLFVSTNW